MHKLDNPNVARRAAEFKAPLPPPDAAAVQVPPSAPSEKEVSMPSALQGLRPRGENLRTAHAGAAPPTQDGVKVLETELTKQIVESMQGEAPPESPDSHSPFIELGFAEPIASANNVTQIREKKELRSVADCLQFVFSCVRKADGSNALALDQLVQQQAQVLLGKGIDSKEKLCDLLKSAKRWDLAAGAAHGIAGGLAFNGGGAAVNFKGAELIGNAAAVDWKAGPTTGQMAIIGGVAGIGLSVFDVASGPAVDKSFGGMYYTKPPAETLPDCMKEAMAQAEHTTGSLAGNLALAFGSTYGGRNAVRFGATVGAIAAGGSKVVGALEDYLDPLGGLAAGAGYRMIRNKLDERAGRAGLQYLLARKDLAQCVDALQSPAREQAARVAKHTVSHVSNMVTRFPEGLCKSLFTAQGWASHIVLGGGFAAVLGLKTEVKNSLADAAKQATLGMKDAPRGLDALKANQDVVGSEGVKHLSLISLYAVYGAVMGTAAMNDPNAANRPYKDILNALQTEIELRRGSPVTIEMTRVSDGDVVIDMPEDDQAGHQMTHI